MVELSGFQQPTGKSTVELRPEGAKPAVSDPALNANRPPDTIPAPLPLPGHEDLSHLSPFTAKDIPPTPDENAWNSPVVEPDTNSPASSHIDTYSNSNTHEITVDDVGRSVEAVTTALDEVNDNIREELAGENGVPLEDVRRILPGYTPSILRASEGIEAALQRANDSVATMLPDSMRHVEDIKPVIPTIPDIDEAVQNAQELIENSAK